MAIDRYAEPTQQEADTVAAQATPIGGLMEPLTDQPEIVPEQDGEYDVAVLGTLKRLVPVPKKVDALRNQTDEAPIEEPLLSPQSEAGEKPYLDNLLGGAEEPPAFNPKPGDKRTKPRVSGVEENARLRNILETERGAGSFAGAIDPEFKTKMDLPSEAEADDVVRQLWERMDDKANYPDEFGHRHAEGALDLFNAGRIESGDDIIDLIATLAKSTNFDDRVKTPWWDESKRGVVTLAAQRQVADLIGASEGRTEKLFEAIMARSKGGVVQMEGIGTAEVMLAARNLMVTLVERTDVGAHKIMRGDATAAELLEFRKQMMVTRAVMAQVKGSQTEIARALGGMRNRASGQQRFLSGAELEEFDARIVEDLLNENGGEKAVKMMAEAWLELPTLEQRAKFARSMNKNAIARGADAIYEAWINALLSNPVSQTRNIVGNGLMLWMKVGERSFQGRVAGPVQRAFGAEGTIAAGEDVAMVYGMIQSLGEAMRASGRAFKTNQSVGFGTGKVEFRSGAFTAETTNVHGTVGRFINVLGEMMTLGRVPTRALQAGDSFFKVLAARMDLYATAYRAADREGLLKGRTAADVDKASDFMAEWIANPPGAAEASAEKLARMVTFTQRLSEHGSGMAKWVRGGGYGIPRWFIPFFVTPMNIAEAIVKHTPLQMATKGWYTDMLGKNGAQAQAKAGYQTALGWGMTLGFCKLAAEGFITGSMPGNKTTRDAWAAQGIKPLTYYPNGIKPGETGYSYAGIEPLSGMVGMSVDICDITGVMDGEAYWEDHDARATFGAVVYAFGTNLLSKTYAEGANKLFEAITGDARDFEKTIQQLNRSVIPRVLAQANRTGVPFLFDGNRDRLDPNQLDNFSETLLRGLQGQTPWASDKVAAHVDWQTGLETSYASSGDTEWHKLLDWVNPTFSVIYQPDKPYASEVTNPSGRDADLDPYPALEEIARLSQDADIALTLRPGWHRGRVNYRGATLYLSDQFMRRDFLSHAGRESIKALTKVMSKSNYDKASLERKHDLVRKAYKRGGQEAIRIIEKTPEYKLKLKAWRAEAAKEAERRRGLK